MADSSAERAPALPPLLRAVHPFVHRQYRVLAAALALSLLGTGVWLVAFVWQVIQLGGSPVELSIVATANAAGTVVAVLLGGAVADRVPQRRILIAVELTKAAAVGTVAAVALTGGLEIWHLAAASLVFGLTDGFFYPAYSALLPSLLPEHELLAANGLEGVLRPAVMQAAGPAAASGLIAVASPGAAFVLVAGSQLLAAAALLLLRPTALRRQLDADDHPVGGLLRDIRDGFGYMVRTPWLFATLVYASVLVFVIMGPIEVLLPFAVKDQTGGGAGAFALAIGAFGVGGAVGSLLVATLRLPRRYLTVMNLLWGLGCVPLVVIGVTDALWVMVAALFVVGFAFSAANVIWGTLLQRRVPPAYLGRVSSLDFFVSLAFMPVSMAVAGPVGEVAGFPAVFFVAGLVPPALATAAILIARMPRDELRHPLDRPAPDGADVAAP